MAISNPVRGEVWLVDLGLAGKIRPALVVSAALGDSDHVLFTIVPHTTQKGISSYEASVAVPQLKDGCFNIQGLASLPKPRFVRRICSLNAGQMEQIEVCLRRWLGL